MAELLAWLEASPLGQAMRGAGVWSYGVVNLVHILGVATLFGSVLVIDLRLLGLWRQVPLAALKRPVVPISACGFAVAVASGLCLISTNGTEYVGNPFLLIKFPAIAVGLVNVAVLRRLEPWRLALDDTPRRRRTLALAGGLSLASWLTAVSAGRMIAYW